MSHYPHLLRIDKSPYHTRGKVSEIYPQLPGYLPPFSGFLSQANLYPNLGSKPYMITEEDAKKIARGNL